MISISSFISTSCRDGESKVSEFFYRSVSLADAYGFIEISSRMKTKFTVDGYDIWLPFEKPYHCQREYVEKVIEALKTGSNAMLESPTGTGKTLSFLCASVAFIKASREKNAVKSKDQVSEQTMPTPHTIIYCTRTHSQIKQVVNEIKTKLPYKVAV